MDTIDLLPCTAAELQRRLGVTKQAASLRLSRLRRLGLACPDHARPQTWHRTDACPVDLVEWPGDGPLEEHQIARALGLWTPPTRQRRRSLEPWLTELGCVRFEHLVWRSREAFVRWVDVWVSTWPTERTGAFERGDAVRRWPANAAMIGEAIGIEPVSAQQWALRRQAEGWLVPLPRALRAPYWWFRSDRTSDARGMIVRS